MGSLTLTARARRDLPMWSVLFLALFLGERSGAAPDPDTNIIIDKAEIDMPDSSSGPEKSQIRDQKNQAQASQGKGGPNTRSGNDYKDHLSRIKSAKAGRGDYAEDYHLRCTCFRYPICSWCRITNGWSNGVGLPLAPMRGLPPGPMG